MNIHQLKVAGVFLATFLIVSACGGSDGGSTPTPPPPGGDPIGGITRTGLTFSAGPVTAFGSVVVNGVRYDTSGANFTVDGQLATQADLAVGDMIIVKGSIDDDNTNSVAASIDFDGELDEIRIWNYARSPEEIAVANDLDPEALLPAGARLKVPIDEPWSVRP